MSDPQVLTNIVCAQGELQSDTQTSVIEVGYEKIVPDIKSNLKGKKN